MNKDLWLSRRVEVVLNHRPFQKGRDSNERRNADDRVSERAIWFRWRSDLSSSYFGACAGESEDEDDVKGHSFFMGLMSPIFSQVQPRLLCCFKAKKRGMKRGNRFVEGSPSAFPGSVPIRPTPVSLRMDWPAFDRGS